jgi:prepilin-type N-terminal cleavage/methylation domain-containing protein
MTRRRSRPSFRRANSRANSREGFTLIEVLAALAVLAAFSLAVTRALVVAREGSVVAIDYVEAEAVARTLLVGPVPLAVRQPGQLSGELEGHRYLIVTQPIDIPLKPRAQDEPPRPDPAFVPLRYTVSVEVDDGRMVKAQTVRLVAREVTQ